ncbi:MAG: transposase domain-containing protein [Clostridium sp.]|nr:transposase domain-containing protein [Clostridium sp.]
MAVFASEYIVQLTSPPFFVFAKSQLLRPITNGFITSRSRTYPQFGIIYAERAVKDFVMARKNFLFSYSEKGAEAARTLMMVIRMARLNQADPEKYIAYVLTQLGKTGQEDIDSLLTWSETFRKR